MGKQRRVELKSVGNLVAKTVLVESANQFSLEELCRTQYSLKYFFRSHIDHQIYGKTLIYNCIFLCLAILSHLKPLNTYVTIKPADLPRDELVAMLQQFSLLISMQIHWKYHHNVFLFNNIIVQLFHYF